jgi:hypothetical protein
MAADVPVLINLKISTDSIMSFNHCRQDQVVGRTLCINGRLTIIESGPPVNPASSFIGKSYGKNYLVIPAPGPLEEKSRQGRSQRACPWYRTYTYELVTVCGKKADGDTSRKDITPKNPINFFLFMTPPQPENFSDSVTELSRLSLSKILLN